MQAKINCIKNPFNYFLITFIFGLSILFLPTKVKGDNHANSTTLAQQKADAAKFLDPNVQKQLSAEELPNDGPDLETPEDIYFDVNQPEVPWPTVIYNKNFGQQYGWDVTKAVDLGPSIEAMTLMYGTHFTLNYSSHDPFIRKYHLDKLTAGEREILNQHLQVLPHLFKKEKMPLVLTYNCYVGVYFDNLDPVVANIQHPDFQFWLADMVPWIEQTAIDPIDELRPANADPMTSFKNQFKKTFNPNFPVALVTHAGHAKYTELSTYAYFANLVPGITYYAFKGTCADLVRSFGQHNAQLWLEKTTSKRHALYQTSKPPKLVVDDFLQFNIPAGIVQSKTLASIVKHDKRAVKEGYYDFNNVVDDVNRPPMNH